MIESLVALLPLLAEEAASAPAIPIEDAVLHAPVAWPGKLVAAPVNYADHLAEARADPGTFAPAQVKRIHEVGLFLKATSSLVGCSGGIVIGKPDRRTDHEIELAVVIGKTAHHVPRNAAMAYVAGYAIGLDITVRGGEERSMRKSIDTYSVLGPWMVTADEIADPGVLDFSLSVNGEIRQQSNTRHLVIDVPGLIEMASSWYRLEPGDVIFTGTPAGVGPILPGDVLTAWIDKIGAMEVAVRGE
jgi:2-keto-4-pentenoate hydratase/2-oxohepta-3-ene-1,7-dioic acid hydratase in catechol pathway